ncbi:PAS domain-containing protein [Dankookia rubra]|nr:PAS domain-containing protein [Dankookia rubra]
MRPLALALIFGMAYLAAALLGHALTLRSVEVASFWPAAGLYLAALLLAPPRRWPMLIAAATAANLASDVLVLGRPPLLVLGFALANALEALAGASLVRLLLHAPPLQPGARMRDTVVLGAAALAAPVAGSVVGAGTVDALLGAPFATVWPVWWAADVVGILVVSPLVLAAAGAWRPYRTVAVKSAAWWLEAAAAHAAVLGSCVAIFWLTTPVIRPPFLTVPPLLWAALRLGPLATASTAAFLALCAAGTAASGFGPFDRINLGPTGQAVLLQLFVGAAAATAQLLSAATTERRAALSRLTAANTGLEAAVAARTSELAASEARLRLATSGAGIGTLELDLATGRGRWSREAGDLLGIGPLEASAETWVEALHPDDRAAAAEAWRRAVEEGAPYEAHFRSAIPAPDGGERWLMSRALVERDAAGIPQRGLGVLIDLTRQRRAELALANSEAVLRLSQEHAGIASFTLDVPSRMLRCGPAALQLFGFPPGSDRMPLEEWHSAIHPDDADRIARQRAAAFGSRAPSAHFEYRVVRPDTGAVLDVEMRARCEYAADGTPLSVLGVAIDVTERKRAETALAASEAQLRTILGTVPVGLILAELPSGRIVNANSYVEQMLRRPVLRSADVDGCEDWVSFHADGRRVESHEYPLARMALADEEEPSIEVHFQRGDGTRAWTRILGRPIRDERGEVAGGVVALVDVDAQRRARDALAESEARLRLALDAAGLGTWGWEVGRGTETLEWDARCKALFGLPTAAVVGYAAWAAALLPEDRVATEAAVARAIDPAEPDDDLVRDYRVVLPGGAVRWLSVHGRAFFEPDPGAPARRRVLRIIGTIHDVTEARTAMARLADTEAVLRLSQQAAGVVSYVQDLPDGAIRTAPGALARLGFPSAQDAISRAEWIALVHPDDAARLVAQVAADLSSGAAESRYEYRIAHPVTGAIMHVEQRTLREWGAGEQFIRAYGVAIDVTARVAAESALARTEARLRLALEAGGMGYWSWDLRTDQLEWDARQFKLFGLDPARGQPSGEDALSTVHPDDLPSLTAAIQGAIVSGDGAFSHEFRIVHAGGVRWIAGHGHAVTGPDGQASRMAGLNMDITARREAEAVLAREAEQLDHLAEERGRALAESERRLAQAARMEALGRLAGGIAHDFNNVLQAVQGGIALASKRLPAEADAVRRYLSIASEAAGRGAAVTGRLLSFARRGELRSEPVAPGPLLEGLAELLGSALGPKVMLRTEVHPDLPTLLADKAQLEAVLVNLANNARDAMPDGGALTLTAEEVTVHDAQPPPHGLQPGTYLRLSVADRGEGMPPEVLARVTEPFFTTKPRGKGTGLGLAMARGFAEQSGGGLSIESTPGLGTTVSVWMPRWLEHAAASSAIDGSAPEPAPPPKGGIAILLAEDKAEVRAVLVGHLEDQGYQVRAAEDAASALAALADGFRPDALVTDFSMPGVLDGLDLLAEVRTQLPRLPAVLVTGHAGEVAHGRMDEAERGGPFALLRKPATPEVLLDRLARVLRQSGTGRAA